MCFLSHFILKISRLKYFKTMNTLISGGLQLSRMRAIHVLKMEDFIQDQDILLSQLMNKRSTNLIDFE